MENKSYSSVIGSPSAPYETQLARQCASDTQWSDAGRQYDSLPSYIAMTTGQSGSILTPFTCDCEPSSSVSVTVDNIFRQVRTAGGSERSYAEGMSGNCSNRAMSLRTVFASDPVLVPLLLTTHMEKNWEPPP